MLDLIESLRFHHPFLASTDISGALGNPQKSHEFWVQATGDSAVGMEFLAWLHSFKYYPETLQDGAPQIGGLHGQMGPEKFRWNDPKDSLLVKVLNRMMEGNEELLERAGKIAASRPDGQVYVLNHTPAAQQWINAGNSTLPKGVTLLVENHVELNSFQNAQSALAQLRQKGLPTEMVFDLVHSMRSRPDVADYEENWNLMLEELREAGRCLIHLPIGTKVDDSLHIDEITPEMWKELSQIIHRNDDYIIIEHQVGQTRKLVRANPMHVSNAKLQARAARLVEMLRSYNVLPAVSALK